MKKSLAGRGNPPIPTVGKTILTHNHTQYPVGLELETSDPTTMH